MKFTKEVPTVAGFWLWRSSPLNTIRPVEVYKYPRGLFCEGRLVELKGGEWCRLLPPEEVEKVYAEGCIDGYNSNSFKEAFAGWPRSRSKRVMEGKE